MLQRRLPRRGARLARVAAAGGGRRSRPTCRSCTASPASAGSRSVSWSGCRGSSGRARCGSATPPRRSCQLDVYGEVLDAAYQTLAHGRRRLADRLGAAASNCSGGSRTAGARRTPGIWEVRGPNRHFTHSKVMAWVAFDRAVRMHEEFGRDGPVERWRQLRDEIKAEVLERGLERAQAGLHAVLRLGRARREHPADAARRLPARRRPALRLDRRGDPARADRGRARAALPRRGRRSTACRRAKACSSPARSGWSRCWRCRAGTTRRGSCSSGCSPCATTSACSPRSTTRSRGRQLGNFPQAFTHLALVDSRHRARRRTAGAVASPRRDVTAGLVETSAGAGCPAEPRTASSAGSFRAGDLDAGASAAAAPSTA